MKFWIGIAITFAVTLATVAFVNFDYFFFAGNTVLMFVMLATVARVMASVTAMPIQNFIVQTTPAGARRAPAAAA